MKSWSSYTTDSMVSSPPLLGSALTLLGKYRNSTPDVYGNAGSSLLSPLGKSIQSAEPAAVDFQGRESLIRRIQHRFRFLAADAAATLRGSFPSYRQTLVAIRNRLNVPCPSSLATHDLEAEIFLFLLQEHAEAVDAAASSASISAAAVAEHANEGDGMALPPSAHRRPNIVQRLLAPIKLGAEEVLPALTKLGATVAVTNLHVNLAQKLGTVLAKRSVQYELALRMALSAGSKGVSAGVQGRLAVSAAQKGLTAAATRYAAVRSLLGFLGPVLWASTFLDLARMSIGTDYARVVRAVFMMAQIRLLRHRGWALADQTCRDTSLNEELET